VAVGSVGPRAARARAAEARLREVSARDTAVLDDAAELAADAADVVADANGSADYKRQLVKVLVQRCLREAIATS
jgi:carbon-monoxide dehydrogenase medium subunit